MPNTADDIDSKNASSAPSHWIEALESHCAEIKYVRLDVRKGRAGYTNRRRWTCTPSAVLDSNDEIVELMVHVDGDIYNHVEACELFYDDGVQYIYDENVNRSKNRKAPLTRVQARIVILGSDGTEIHEIAVTKGTVIQLDDDGGDAIINAEDESAGLAHVLLRDERRTTKRLHELLMKGYERMDNMAESVNRSMASSVSMANDVIAQKSEIVDEKIKGAIALVEAKADERRDEAMFAVLDKVTDRLFDHWDGMENGPGEKKKGKKIHPAERVLNRFTHEHWNTIATVCDLGEDWKHLRDAIELTMTDKEKGFAVIASFAPRLQQHEEKLKEALPMECLHALDRFNDWLVKQD